MPSTSPVRPTVFVGSSIEGLPIAEHLQALLDEHAEVTVWNQGVFGLTRSALDELVQAARRSDFAILVLRGDDLVVRRGRAGRIPRDNVTFELGLFIGALGPERTFMIHARKEALDVPSDLLGITAALYNDRSDGNLLAALGPAALKIRQAIERVGSIRHPRGELEGDLEQILHDLADLKRTYAAGLAGVVHRVTEEAVLARWTGNVLGALAKHFRQRQNDSYVAWMRPTLEPRPRLAVRASRNLQGANRHYKFASDEGLAGRVWSTGVPAAHSLGSPHPWWVFREGCENASYICAPVGGPHGPGGVLAIGSNDGFTIRNQDAAIVTVFASALCGAIPDTGSKGK